MPPSNPQGIAVIDAGGTMRTDTRTVGGDLIPLRLATKALGTHKFFCPVALVCDLLEQRAGDVSQAEMAALLGCSQRQARRVFRYIAGESFRSAQIRARLTAARSLVRQSSVRISHISERFGYSRRAKFDKSYESAF